MNLNIRKKKELSEEELKEAYNESLKEPVNPATLNNNDSEEVSLEEFVISALKVFDERLYEISHNTEKILTIFQKISKDYTKEKTNK